MKSLNKQKQLSRRDFVKSSAALGLSFSAAGLLNKVQASVPGSHSGKRPNIILIITDDQDKNTLGCYGGNVLTPNIDRMAKEGVLFTNGYTSSSVCTPARYTCMAGRYAGRSEGLLEHTPENVNTRILWNTPLEADGCNIAGVLKKAGYTTGLVGKWHLGIGRKKGGIDHSYKWTDKILKKPGHFGPKADPEDPVIARYLKQRYELVCDTLKKTFGFDYAASLYPGNMHNYMPVEKLQAHNMEWVAKGAIDFIKANKEKPFFLHIGTTLHHGVPYLPDQPAELRELSRRGNRSLRQDERITMAGLSTGPLGVDMPERASVVERLEKKRLSAETAYCTWLDDGIGAVLGKLDELGLAEDTLIIYFADQQQLGKGTCYERGVNTPLIVRWKRHIKPGQICDELVQNIDFAPTIFDVCGTAPPEEMHLDGRSFAPLLLGKKPEKWRDALFFELGNWRAVRTKKWKYIAYRHPESPDFNDPEMTVEEKTKKDFYYKVWYIDQRRKKYYTDIFITDQLFDLEKDPEERNNLAGKTEYKEQLKYMQTLLKDWLATFPRPYFEFSK